MEGATAADWVGRVEEREGALTPVLAAMMKAALGHPAMAEIAVDPGAAMPPLWHWAAFPEFVPIGEIGRDGHPRLGRFLPPVALERRMWAGGRLSFEGGFAVGETLRRRSEILKIAEKEGSTGRMVFVTVGHRIEGAGGRIEEEQDIVYIAMPEDYRPPKALPAPEAPLFDEAVEMSEVRLFRFSAATFNAHRIHYDLPYAREVEKYPGLIVHGPMQAMLLMEAATRHAGRAPARFRFRGVHPMFAHHGLRLLATEAEAGLALCTAADAAAGGHRGLDAEIGWA